MALESLVLLIVVLGWECCCVVSWNNRFVFPAVLIGTPINQTRNKWVSIVSPGQLCCVYSRGCDCGQCRGKVSGKERWWLIPGSLDALLQ